MGKTLVVSKPVDYLANTVSAIAVGIKNVCVFSNKSESSGCGADDVAVSDGESADEHHHHEASQQSEAQREPGTA